jgi:hypothetical protein
VKAGDIVQYKNHHGKIHGKVIATVGKKWLKIEWSDRVVLSEHREDVTKISKNV